MFIVVFILTILILVIIHELGHFLVAKKFNIKVLEFGFGIPPRAWGKKIGETIWSLNWLPFGGFVRLLGEDESDPEVLDNRRSFAAQTVWKRISVVAAGVVMNLALAWVLFYIVLGVQGFKTRLPLLADYKFTGISQTVENVIVVGNIVPDSPAFKAGLKDGDRIIALNGNAVEKSDKFVEAVKADAGKEVVLTIADIAGNNKRDVVLVPRENPPAGQGALGVSLGGMQTVHLSFDSPIQKLLAAPIYSYNIIGYSGKILGDTIGYSFQKRDLGPVSNAVAGPVGITAVVGQILSVKNPLIPYLDFVAALSLNLAVVNVLPFPGLDGGRLLFLAIEGITRKKTHAVIEKYVHTIGLVVLLGLIVLITISDIRKLVF
ncbi:site-2 protease family protein [Candidatus Daviesbacteria bacterium]|nr:site-2 protease family protein [Candidatus Daviesbacteria bacterium]